MIQQLNFLVEFNRLVLTKVKYAEYFKKTILGDGQGVTGIFCSLWICISHAVVFHFKQNILITAFQFPVPICYHEVSVLLQFLFFWGGTKARRMYECKFGLRTFGIIPLKVRLECGVRTSSHSGHGRRILELDVIGLQNVF